MSPVGAIFVPFPPKTGTNMLHYLPPQSLNLFLTKFSLSNLGIVLTICKVFVRVILKKLY